MLVLLVWIGPAAFVLEAIDMIRMRATTQATIESVRVERGGKFGSSRPIIQFAYTVDGTRYSSRKFCPGHHENSFWTGGESAARAFTVGSPYPIHYDPSSPGNACLLFGWHKATVFFLAIGGLIALPWWAQRASRFRGARPELAASIALVWVVPAFFGPSVVPPAAVLLALPAPLLLFLISQRVRSVGKLLRRVRLA
ncbi:MAG: DUF3592 domain-containing protein [Phycisphaerales bacterium]|nr:DUF3592 domain-containing protein [Phycisphaerales bacterium]